VRSASIGQANGHSWLALLNLGIASHPLGRGSYRIKSTWFLSMRSLLLSGDSDLDYCPYSRYTSC